MKEIHVSLDENDLKQLVDEKPVALTDSIAAVAMEFSCELLHKDKDFASIAQCVDLRLAV